MAKGTARTAGAAARIPEGGRADMVGKRQFTTVLGCGRRGGTRPYFCATLFLERETERRQ